MLPSFSIKLNNPVLQGLMTMGRFDGVHPAVALASGADNVVIHSPHTRNEKSEHDVKTLSINRRITALASGNLTGPKEPANSPTGSAGAGAGGKSAADSKAAGGSGGGGAGTAASPGAGGAGDVLVVGSASNLLVYDVHNNSDVFYKDVADGVFSLAVGSMPNVSAPIAVVGSNCAIQGYDLAGEERYWTVTGDNVTALAFRETREAGRSELLVGGEDFEIRVLRHEEVIAEIQEADAVTGLTGLTTVHRDSLPLFGYALRNGTIGVYNKSQRLWHAKSKHKVTAVAAFDLDGDGVPELISGWSNGRMEVRRDTDGTLVAKHKFDSAIAGICVGDYHMDGKQEIVACSVDGEVRGFAPLEKEQDNSALLALQNQQNALKQLTDMKSQLLSELKSYEANLKKSGAPTAGSGGAKDANGGGALNAVVGVIPSDTKIAMSVRPNLQTKSLLLTVGTNNDTVVKFLTVFADGLFGGNESCVAHPLKPASALAMAIAPEKDTEALLTIKAAIGVRNSVQDHVYEATFNLPKFASYVYVTPQQIHEHKIPLPRSSVTFRMAERANRIALWISQAFLLEEKTFPAAQLESLHAGFLSTRDGTPLFLILSPENGGQLQVRTDNLELAADIVQDMCRYLKVDQLESVVDFPTELANFEAVLQRVQEFYAQRLKLSAEMADSSNLVKNLVVRAEDSRLLNDMTVMMRMYSGLMDANRELIGESTKRANNNAELSKNLKEVNQIIQKAARLRMGDAKTQLVDACRKAVQTNNTQQLLKLVKFGVTVSAAK